MHKPRSFIPPVIGDRASFMDAEIASGMCSGRPPVTDFQRRPMTIIPFAICTGTAAFLA